MTIARRLQKAAAGAILNTTINHGQQITNDNTGYTAYFDEGLGRELILSDLEVISGNHWLSDYIGPGGTITKKHFTGSIQIDVDDATIVGCLFDRVVSNYLNGVHASGTQFNWCTIAPVTVGDIGIYFQGFSAYRCSITGSADGLRINGGATTQDIVECYIRVEMLTNDDHNDALQNVGGDGTVNIVRCNLSVNPEGGILGGGTGGPNAAIMSADMSGSSSYALTLQDCLVEGTGSTYSLRLYDGALSTNILYTATGNKHVRPGASISEIHRGSANITPLNQITWSNNTWADDGTPIVLL